MGLSVDASNACIPLKSPLYALYPPLPSTTRGESVSLDTITDHNNNTVLLYANGRLIIARFLNLASTQNIQAFIYRGHTCNVTCARFSSSKSYVASCDIRGNLRVWSYDNEEHLCKLNIKALGGPIRDVAWDATNKKICIVGDTSVTDACCRFIQWDTGVNIKRDGGLGQHTRNRVRTCSIRSKPKEEKQPYNYYCIVTGGSEDHSIILNENSMRTFECNTAHSRGAVHSVKFSHDGMKVVSAGADHGLCLFDLKDKKLDILHHVKEAHDASIYSCDWSFDDSYLISCSVDGTVKKWSSTDLSLIQTWNVLTQQAPNDDYKSFVDGMQMGCIFYNQTQQSLSVGFNGHISLLEASDKAQVLSGHQSPIATMSLYENNLYTADTDGIVCHWDVTNGTCHRVNGIHKIHTATISSICFVQAFDYLLTVGWDDCIRICKDTETKGKFIAQQDLTIKLESQPNLIVTGKKLSAIVTVAGIVLLKDGAIVSKDSIVKFPYEPLSACISSDDSTLCIGANNNNIYIYAILHDFTIQETHTITAAHLKPITCLQFSPNDSLLASADSRDVCIFDFQQDYKPIISKNRWCFHAQKITNIAFLNNNLLATAGLDDSIFLWSLTKKMTRLHYPHSHRGGITGLAWWQQKLISAGNDACICIWDVEQDCRKKFGHF